MLGKRGHKLVACRAALKPRERGFDAETRDLAKIVPRGYRTITQTGEKLSQNVSAVSPQKAR